MLHAGGLTSRIGAGTKQKAKPGTEKVGRTQKAKPAPPPRKAERKQKAEPARETQKVRAGQPKGNPLGRFGTISSRGRKDANTVGPDFCIKFLSLAKQPDRADAAGSLKQQPQAFTRHAMGYLLIRTELWTLGSGLSSVQQMKQNSFGLLALCMIVETPGYRLKGMA